MRTLLVAVLFLTVAFAGCSDGGGGGNDPAGDPDASGTSTQTGTSSQTGSASASSTRSGSGAPQPNRAPVAQLGSNVTSGSAPLQVRFTLAGTDPDGDALTYTLDLGDGAAAKTGSLPATVNHTFAVGNYTIELTVSDGKLADNATVSIAALAGKSGGIPPVVTFTGTATGFCGDAGFLLTATDGECFPDEVTPQHTFTMTSAVSKVVILLEWEVPYATDLDLYIYDLGGEEVGQSGCANLDPYPNPALPVVGPAFGCVRGASEEATITGISQASDPTWSALVYPYQAAEVDYTLTVTYS
jgi:PKD repeat protein